MISDFDYPKTNLASNDKAIVYGGKAATYTGGGSYIVVCFY